MRRKPGVAIPRQVWNGLPFHIFAADPGGTSGIATAQWEPSGPDDQLTSIDQIKFNRWSMGPEPHHVELWSHLDEVHNHIDPYTEIVWESFEFRQHFFTDAEGKPIAKMKVELISREYIGILLLFCELFGVPYHHRTASSAKRFITDEKIKQLGLWIPGKAHEHEMDGTRHLLRYMTIAKKIQRPFTDIWLPD